MATRRPSCFWKFKKKHSADILYIFPTNLHKFQGHLVKLTNLVFQNGRQSAILNPMFTKNDGDHSVSPCTKHVKYKWNACKIVRSRAIFNVFFKMAARRPYCFRKFQKTARQTSYTYFQPTYITFKVIWRYSKINFFKMAASRPFCFEIWPTFIEVAACPPTLGIPNINQIHAKLLAVERPQQISAAAEWKTMRNVLRPRKKSVSGVWHHYCSRRRRTRAKTMVSPTRPEIQ